MVCVVQCERGPKLPHHYNTHTLNKKGPNCKGPVDVKLGTLSAAPQGAAPGPPGNRGIGGGTDC